MVISPIYIGRYARFLMNEYKCSVKFNGRTYHSVAHAFLAARSMHPADHRVIAACRRLKQATLKAQEITMKRPFWNKCRLGIMLGLLESKFSNPILKRMLLKTHPRAIVAKGLDPYWQIDTVTGHGENQLGILLTIVRDNIRLNRGTPYTDYREYARNKVKRWRLATRTKNRNPRLKPIPVLPWRKGFDFGHEYVNTKRCRKNPAIDGRWRPSLKAEIAARVAKELEEYEKTAKRPDTRRVGRLPKGR